ncbi:MAG TPA: ABC transporter permease [Gemmatimonadales bacterium]|jgi:predicted permease
MNDFQHAVRQLVKHPGFTAVAVLTLALGLGAATALLTVLHSVVLAPLPYDAPDELVRLDSPVPRLAPEAVWGLSEAGYFHFRSGNRTLADIGAFSTARQNMASDQGASRVATAATTRSLLEVLRARPALGRLFTEEEARPSGPSVIVLGYDFWVRQFGADSSIIGSLVDLETIQHEIVGVMAPGTHLPDYHVDVWAPLRLDPLRAPVNAHWLAAIARLRPATSVAGAQADIKRLTDRLPDVFPQAYYPGFMDNYGFSTRVTPLHEAVVGPIARVLWILLGATALVLAIAAANVANLFAVRVEGRRREFAVRVALGAGRRHLVRQGMAEGVTLAVAAGALGLALADGAVRLLLTLAPAQLPRLDEIRITWSVAGVALLSSVLVGAVVGLFPFLRTRIGFATVRDALERAATPAQLVVRRTLVATQVALAVVLLAAAGLMVRSLARLNAVEPGLDPANAVTFELSLPAARYNSYEAVAAFYHRLVEQVEALPGVRAAGAGSLPFRDFGGCALLFVEDQPVVEDERPRCVSSQVAAPGYFEALGIPIRGRAPTWNETQSASAGAVVTAALARRLWPGEDAIGKGVRGNGWGQPFYRVVGVTSDLRAQGLDMPSTEAVFYPMIPLPDAPLWSPPRFMTLIARVDGGGPATLIGPMRRILTDLDPSIPLGNVSTMEAVVGRSLGRRSFAMVLLGIAAGMALLLSIVGLYGVIAYLVGQRTREIGIRMALGAPAEHVAASIVRDAVALAGVGCAVGLAGAIAVTGTLESLLFEVSPTDPWTLAGVTAVLLGVAGMASLLPARRAARVDPMQALRYE